MSDRRESAAMSERSERIIRPSALVPHDAGERSEAAS
jgi:hypothetical protein